MTGPVAPENAGTCQYCGRSGAAQPLIRGGLACGPCVNELPGLRSQLAPVDDRCCRPFPYGRLSLSNQANKERA